jgi:hypothetical protein
MEAAIIFLVSFFCGGVVMLLGIILGVVLSRRLT